MTAEKACISAARLLGNAAGEMDDMAALLRHLEQVVCETVSRHQDLAAARARELQAFDLIAQRISGLSACLGLLASEVEGPAEIPTARIAAVLPLAHQRDVLLSRAPTASRPRAEASLELF